MNKNKYILLLLLVLLGTMGHAQRHNQQLIQAYPSIGFTVSQIEGDELKGFDKWGITTGVGAMVNLSPSEMFKLSVEANFTQRGAFNNSGNPYSLYDFSLNYVDIPVMFHFQDPIGGIQLGLGVTYGRLVQQPHGLMKYDPLAFMPDTSNFSFLKNDLAIVASFRFTIWQGLKFDLRYHRSILPVKRQWQFTEHINAQETNTWYNDCYNQSVSVRLLYVFGDDGHKPKAGYYKHHNSKKRRR